MSRHSQQGLTTIGWIAIIGIFGILVITGFKILPLYLEYFQVRSVLDSIATDESVDDKSKRELWTAVSKRLLINQVRSLDKDDFTFNREDGMTTITADYEVRKPYVAQLFIGGHFTYSVTFKR